MAGIEIKVDDNELQASFNRLIAAVGNPAPALRALGAYQERQYQKAFSQNRSPTGQPWAPLAASTIARKRNSKMLVETVGRIPSSLFYQVRGDTVEVGYGDPLAAVHHFGSTIRAQRIVPKNKKALYWAGAAHPVKSVNRPQYKIPARPLIGYSQADVAGWRGIIEEELSRKL